MSDWKKASIMRELTAALGYYVQWSDKAAVAAEMGKPDFGWVAMSARKGEELRELLDDADRSGVEIPNRASFEVGSIPTRYKLREELQAANAEMAEVRKHLAKESVVFVQARKRLDFEVQCWQWVAVVAGGVALLGWLR